MRQSDVAQAGLLDAGLRGFDQNHRALPGIVTEERRQSLVRQMIDSLHRIEYARRLGNRDISPSRQNPGDPLFDPLKAAVLYLKAGNQDEAGWLIFLSTHFGYHLRYRWAATQMVYGALGGTPWTWQRTAANLPGFRAWFEQNANALARVRFGNHRKYESIKVDVRENLADVVASYVDWVGANRGHMQLFSQTFHACGDNPRATFDALYKSMSVKRFGRTGKFDYLTMMEKLGLWDIDPPHPYFGNATGPVEGASLLFTNNRMETLTRPILSGLVVDLGDAIGVNMQVMEDSLCNWQKAPDRYVPFRG